MLRRCVLKTQAWVYGGACHLMYGYLDYIVNQIFVSTADSIYLSILGSENDCPKNAAVAATGSCATTGTTGILIPMGTELQSTANNIYITNSDVTIVGGTATLAFTAKDADATSNDSAGITLTFVSPIVGVSSTATVDSSRITGGEDEETDDAYRARILFKKRNPSKGGCRTDFSNWVKEVSGNTRVWVFCPGDTAFTGVNGQVQVVFTRDNDTPYPWAILPTAGEIATTLAYLIQHTDPLTGLAVGVPVTMANGILMLTPAIQYCNFDISISPNTTAVQNAITTELANLLYNNGGPGQTIYKSQIDEAISAAVGEDRHLLNFPVGNITSTITQIPVMGTMTWSSY